MPRAWILLFLCFFTAGCGEKLRVVGGWPPDWVPQREVSLSPSTTEILMVQGDSTRLKGRTSSCDYPLGLDSVPIVAGVKPDYEKLEQVAPDFVIYDAGLYSPADIEKIKSIKGVHVAYELNANNIEDFEKQLRELGVILMQSMKMSQYIDKIEGEREAAKSAPLPKPLKVAAFTGDWIDGTKGFLADVIRSAGGQPAGPDVDRFVPADPEALIQSNPDVILLATDITRAESDAGKKKEVMQRAVDQFMANPKFRSVKAVMSRHVYPVDGDVLLRRGSRVDVLIHAMGTIFHAAESN